MKPKRTSAAEPAPIRVVIVTLDSHLASATERASAELARELPGLSVRLHAIAEWHQDAEASERCRRDIEQGDIIVVTMLFMEEHIRTVLPWLQARREHCDAMVACMCAAEVARLTRIGQFCPGADQGGALALLKRLRGSKGQGGSAGAQQMRMLRRLPKLLRFIPGTAQDVRAYFLVLQYWLAGSDDNVANMVRLLVDRYADGPRRSAHGRVRVGAPIDYAEVGLYHPGLPGRVTDRLDDLPAPCPTPAPRPGINAHAAPAPRAKHGAAGTVGLLVMRSYVLAGNTAHYDAVIAALEVRGLRVLPAFASGLDARPAVQRFFMSGGQPCIDALLSLTGFSLVGGPAYNDAQAAEQLLASLDVPYLAALPIEFQTLEQWQHSERGLLPVEATMMVAIPELDGATQPMVFGGRAPGAQARSRDMQPIGERVQALADRVAKMVALRRSAQADRKLAIVIFNFPPNAGNTGTAMHLAVFESLHRTLIALAEQGYQVEVPADVETLRRRIVEGNAARFGAHANVHVRVPAEQHVRRERWLREIEAQWGPAPGKQQSDGATIHVLGERFGNVFVGVQPAFGYEGDPMRLLFEKGFAPTHAFSALYRFIREDFGAHALLHFGTHGALEFMPGKQAGLSGECWPDRLIGALPHFYLYAANNPSEGTIAKRRAGATLVSYLTPPMARAGLYRGLVDLKGSIERWRHAPPEAAHERGDLLALIQTQAVELELAVAEPAWMVHDDSCVHALHERVVELEHSLIPHGLHVVGCAPSPSQRTDMLLAIDEAGHGTALDRAIIESVVHGESLTGLQASTQCDQAVRERLDTLSRIDAMLREDHELPAILRALDGRFIAPAPGGEVVCNASVLPTGRNLHGFDPFRIPSVFAMRQGTRQAEALLARHCADGNALPESIALVLWGSDNLKSEGGSIAQALALIGARPRFDGYGRLAGATLVPPEELGRPRIDVVVTLSGIFRDLLPLQTRLLAEAVYLAASADEPLERNFVRKHTLAHQLLHHCDFDTAALRVFSNADGAYGANVSHLVQSGRWNDPDELAETYSQRKCFAYGRDGRAVRQSALLESALAQVKLAYQNLDSVEVGVTTVDIYFDTLGGISRAVQRASGNALPVYIADNTRGDGKVRTLNEQVELETRTRALNPKWYEGMLQHGYEGVRQIELAVTHTMGWSATTGQVEPWVYRELTRTFVLDEAMRDRLAKLNPHASAQVAHRLLEAHERNFWSPDPATLEALRRAGLELEDRIEGVYEPSQALQKAAA